MYRKSGQSFKILKCPDQYTDKQLCAVLNSTSLKIYFLVKVQCVNKSQRIGTIQAVKDLSLQQGVKSILQKVLQFLPDCSDCRYTFLARCCTQLKNIHRYSTIIQTLYSGFKGFCKHCKALERLSPKNKFNLILV